jgi:hypothetical protein
MAYQGFVAALKPDIVRLVREETAEASSQKVPREKRGTKGPSREPQAGHHSSQVVSDVPI